MSNIQDVRQIADTLYRRKWWIVLCAALGLGAAFGALTVITPRYQATTRVMVEPQRIPSDYVKSTVTQRLEDRLKTLEQQITSPDVLEQVIEEANLFPELQGQVADERLVNRARNNLEIHVSKGSIFSVTFQGRDRHSVALAANRIAELFIEENLRLRETQAEGTTQFLEGELEETKLRLEEQEELVSKYNLRHAGSLPEQQATNLAAMSQLEKRLEITRGELEEAQMQRLVLERDAAGYTPSGDIKRSPVSPRVSQLEELRLELIRLRTQYTEEHPDVIRLQAEINRTQGLVGETSPVEDISDPVDIPNPVDVDLNETEMEIQRLEVAQERVFEEMAAVQRRLEATPRVEQGLISLTRDYDNLKRSYQDLLSKQLEAKLAENLEKTQQAEQFRILERAGVPSAPYYPDRNLFTAMGLGLGLALGIGLALLRDRLDESIETLGELRRAFPAVAFNIGIPQIEMEQVDEKDKSKTDKVRRLA